MKIVVLAGGISTERDVSLVSGMGIYKALKSKGHQVMLLDVFLGYANEDWKPFRIIYVVLRVSAVCIYCSPVCTYDCGHIEHAFHTSLDLG